MRIENLQNENRKYAKSIGNFHVLEYVQDASVSPMNAMNEQESGVFPVFHKNGDRPDYAKEDVHCVSGQRACKSGRADTEQF